MGILGKRDASCMININDASHSSAIVSVSHLNFTKCGAITTKCGAITSRRGFITDTKLHSVYFKPGERNKSANRLTIHVTCENCAYERLNVTRLFVDSTESMRGSVETMVETERREV